MTFVSGTLRGKNAFSTAQLPADDVNQIFDLNRSLHILATIFPDVLPEVFREALQAFPVKSRLEVVVDRLLRNQDEWVRGRWRPVGDDKRRPRDGQETQPITPEDEFRQASYRWASYSALCQEFKAVNKSAIRAVLAEENHSYTRARSKLRQLAAKGWRSALNALWTRLRKSAEEQRQHPMLICPRPEDDGMLNLPCLKATGDAELDAELYESVLAPLLSSIQSNQELQDKELADALNEQEAQAVGALYECQCCFTGVPFEQVISCTACAHLICHRCTYHAISEAVFGQGWARNIDHFRGLLKCPSISTQNECCDGCMPHGTVERILRQQKGGAEMWTQLETRLTEESVSQAGLAVVKCPFCSYKEVDELFLPPNTVTLRLNLSRPKHTVLVLLATLTLLPLITFYALFCHVSCFTPPRVMVARARDRLVRHHHLPLRFQCRSTSCGLQSCLNCSKPWRDMHICYESAAVSLRTAIEGARTAALKRTCPRCSLAFVKDSGCNKLVCVCGYAMCYICRQGLGGDNGGGHGGGAGEGYRHFCQHFRPSGGDCRECDRCDLYRSADEDELVLHAGLAAEKAWREKEGMVGVAGIEPGTGNRLFESPHGRNSWMLSSPSLSSLAAGKWNLQGLVDWWFATLVTC